MSGGSYDHLYFNARDLGGYRGQLEAMAERLEELPYATEAAAATRRILTALEDEALADVWKAVEWWDSGDWSEDMVREALAAYRGSKVHAAVEPVPSFANAVDVLREAFLAAVERHKTHPPRLRLDPDGIYRCPDCDPVAPSKEQP